MDVNKLDSIAPLLGSKDKRKQEKPDERPDNGDNRHAGAFAHGHNDHEVHDEISIMGIPPQEMTPAVREAINLLLEEIHHLRENLSRSRGHEAFLERHADEHPFLPVINHRALVARLGQVLTRARDTDIKSSFIYLHVRNTEHARSRFGHDAEEALLQRVAETLRDVFGTDGIIGSMDNADFGVILPVTDEEEARGKMNEATEALRSAFVMWEGVSLSPDVLAGFHTFSASDSPEHILRAADDDLVRRGKLPLEG